jgi:hypothetical protein
MARSPRPLLGGANPEPERRDSSRPRPAKGEDRAPAPRRPDPFRGPVDQAAERGPSRSRAGARRPSGQSCRPGGSSPTHSSRGNGDAWGCVPLNGAASLATRGVVVPVEGHELARTGSLGWARRRKASRAERGWQRKCAPVVGAWLRRCGKGGVLRLGLCG